MFADTDRTPAPKSGEKGISQADLAKEAGVSLGTANDAINTVRKEQGGMSSEEKAFILALSAQSPPRRGGRWSMSGGPVAAPGDPNGPRLWGRRPVVRGRRVVRRSSVARLVPRRF